MANPTVSTPRNYQVLPDQYLDYPMAAAKIYEGTALSDTGSPSAGTNVAHALVSGENFLGFANGTTDNSGGTSGSMTINAVASGVVQLVVTGVTAASLGANVYATDGNTFTTTPGGSKVGRVLRIVTGTTVLVHFNNIGYVDEYFA